MDTFKEVISTDPRYHGLSLREYYAGLAMQGMLANSYSNGVSQPLSETGFHAIAQFAVEQADALLLELEETE